MRTGRRPRGRAEASTWRQRRSAAATLAEPAPTVLPLGITPRSALTFAVLAIVLLAPWPRYGRAVSAMLGLYGNAVIAVTGAGGDAEPRFSSSGPAAADAGDWTVWLGATRGPAAGRPPAPLEMRILGYTPLALLLALTIATEASWRRRLKMLGLGWALLLTRLAIAIALPVGRAFGGGRASSGPLSEIVWYVLIDLPAMSYAAPLGAWWISFATTND
jgi:hypothetical protein